MTNRREVYLIVIVYKRPFIPTETVEPHALPRRPKFFQRDLVSASSSSGRNDQSNGGYERKRQPTTWLVKPSGKSIETGVHQTRAILIDGISTSTGDSVSLTLQSWYEFVHTRELQLQDLSSIPISKHTLLGRVERQLCPGIDDFADDRQPLQQDNGAQPG